MTNQSRLIRDAAMVGRGELPAQHQEPTLEQLSDLLTLAVLFGLYDAAEHLRLHYLKDIKTYEDLSK